jgi:LCP family protein required for cell wall assembly
MEDKAEIKETEIQKKTNRKGLKILIVSMITIMTIILIIIGMIFLYINSKLNKINYIEIGKAEMNEGVNEILANYRNIAILGIDSYVDVYEEDGRSDNIMIARLNETTNEIKVISVYRDTYVEIPGYGLGNINHAYMYGGPELALSTININMDLNITEFVVVNFDSVINTIDILGGVEIKVTSEETKYINAYINGLSRNTGIRTQNITREGMHMLDGVQAVAYSRIRYTYGGDHKRTERMRTVLNEMLKQAQRTKLADLLKAVDEILPLITTNINKSEIMPTLIEISKYSISEGIGWPYNVREYIDSDNMSAWRGVPITLESNVERLHKEMFGNENYIPTERVQEISRRIIEKTGFSE